jgi:hypothetical protein
VKTPYSPGAFIYSRTLEVNELSKRMEAIAPPNHSTIETRPPVTFKVPQRCRGACVAQRVTLQDSFFQGLS